MSYGKINPETNYLMTCAVNPDGTYRPLTDFVVKQDGEHYTHYINRTTPDHHKQSIGEAIDKKFIIEQKLKEEGFVDYSGHVYSCLFEDKLTVAAIIQYLMTPGADSTQLIFDKDSIVVEIDLGQAQDILKLIAEKQYAIIDLYS